MKNLLLFTACLMIVSHACETEQEADLIQISAEIPAVIPLGQKDTLKFTVNCLRTINSINLKEVFPDQDTVTWASVGRNILDDTTHYYRVNFLYNPKDPGEKNMFLFVRSADIYTETYPFKILVTE